MSTRGPKKDSVKAARVKEKRQRRKRKLKDFTAACIAYGLFITFCAAFTPLAWEIIK